LASTGTRRNSAGNRNVLCTCLNVCVECCKICLGVRLWCQTHGR
jgi:hypothetical protein